MAKTVSSTDVLETLGQRFRLYAAGVGIAAVALLLQAALHHWIGNQAPFLFLIPAVCLAAALLGRGPAVLVAAAGALNGAMFYPPVGSWRIAATQDGVAEGAYLLLCATIILYAGRVRVSAARVALAEKHLTFAQEDTGVGVYELDFVNNVAFVSPSLRQMLGRSGGERLLPLDRWLASLDPQSVAETRRVLEERASRGELRYEREQRTPLADGSVRWLLTRVRIDLTASGKLARARGATVDITDRKLLDERLHRAQAALQEQIADMRRLHALSQNLVAAGDDLSASMQAVLALVLDFTAARHGLVALRNASDAGLYPAACQDLPADVGQAVASVVLGAGQGNDLDLSQVHANARGAGFPTLAATPLASSSGELIGLIVVLFPDVRQREEREIRLTEVCASMAAAVVERERARACAAVDEQRFAVALKSASVPFNILSPVRDAGGTLVDLRWTYVNPAGAKMLGLDAANVVGRKVTEILPRNWETPGLLDRYAAVIERGEAFEFETPASLHSPGVWWHVIASPLLGSAAVWFSDISERKRHERSREEADRRKDEFLATLAHELRNPLAPIRQGIRVARAVSATEAQKSWSHDVIERQVKNMALLLDDLLDVSRVSRGTLLLRKTVVDLKSVIDAAVEVARPHIEARRHQLTIHLPDTAVAIDVDPLRIAQVVGNLLTNAAKYTDPEGLIRLDASVENRHLAIHVIDNGIGLTPDQLSRLFEMFAQAPSAVDRSQGGLGIGLALARSLVKLHGGDIDAQSPGPQRGSEFVVRLPDAVRAKAALPVGDAVAPPTGFRRILIADDNADAADSLAELLRIDGHDVHVAYDGQQALAKFSRVMPDAALLDVGMPKLSGLDVARAIRELPGGKQVTMIAITGWGQSRDRLAALEAGFDHHATKPVDPAHIIRLIHAGPAAESARASKASVLPAVGGGR